MSSDASGILLILHNIIIKSKFPDFFFDWKEILETKPRSRPAVARSIDGLEEA